MPNDVAMLTVMHTLTKDIPAAIDVIKANYSGPIGAYAHWGKLIKTNWRFNDMISATAYADEAQKWIDAGIQLVGGCCGIGPEHIRVLTQRFGRVSG